MTEKNRQQLLAAFFQQAILPRLGSSACADAMLASWEPSENKPTDGEQKRSD